MRYDPQNVDRICYHCKKQVSVMERLRAFFEGEGIASFGCVPYDGAFVSREKYLADRYTGARVTLCAFAVPYYVEDARRNISVYAVPQDYHLYFDGLFARLYEYAALHLPDVSLRAFSDTSPFDERALAAACGLGSVGDNGLLINPLYGSYVFLGSIVCSASLTPPAGAAGGERQCTHCGACSAACPSPGLCLSRITQTKGELSGEHIQMIKDGGCAWGCDICQSVCPANAGVPESGIEFFRVGRIPWLTPQTVRDMSKEQFARRAYAWKGRACILRNLEILKDKNTEE